MEGIMNAVTSAPELLPTRAAQVGSSVDEQRSELQRRIDLLRQSGALPAPVGGDGSASVAQWTNWSNG
jgi:hypothetical protein